MCEGRTCRRGLRGRIVSAAQDNLLASLCRMAAPPLSGQASADGTAAAATRMSWHERKNGIPPAARVGSEDGSRRAPAGATANRTSAAIRLDRRARERRDCAITSSFRASMMVRCARRATSRADAVRRMSLDDVYGATTDHHGQWFCYLKLVDFPARQLRWHVVPWGPGHQMVPDSALTG